MVALQDSSIGLHPRMVFLRVRPFLLPPRMVALRGFGTEFPRMVALRDFHFRMAPRMVFLPGLFLFNPRMVALR
eukprot:3041711-Karenia_brevis.AAC.1